MQTSFFPKENPIHPHYIHILSTHCILLSKAIMLVPKIAPQNGKNASQFLKGTFSCSRLKDSLRLAYLLQNKFQTLICTQMCW